MTTHTRRSLKVDGGRVQVDSTGSGPDLVIIHSLLTGPEAFERVTDSLSAKLRVHRIYLPGFGESTPLDKPHLTIADLADHVALVIRALDRGPTTTLLGNGLGSFVALTFAIRHGSAIDFLVASNTGATFPEERRGAFTTMSSLAEQGGMSAVADVAVARIFPSSYAESHPEALMERRTALEGIEPVAFAAASRALADLDLTSQLPSITNPTLVIAGEIDQTTPPDMGRSVASLIPGARFAMIPDCGHCPQLEKPEALISEIERFIAEHRR